MPIHKSIKQLLRQRSRVNRLARQLGAQYGDGETYYSGDMLPFKGVTLAGRRANLVTMAIADRLRAIESSEQYKKDSTRDDMSRLAGREGRTRENRMYNASVGAVSG